MSDFDPRSGQKHTSGAQSQICQEFKTHPYRIVDEVDYGHRQILIGQ